MRVFQEQMEALLAGGVDLFIIETMSSLDELAVAVRTARAVSKLPVVAQLSFSVEGHTMLGTTPEDAVKVLAELGDEMPDVFGINCGAGPGPVFDSLLRLTEAAKARGLVQPAGCRSLAFQRRSTESFRWALSIYEPSALLRFICRTVHQSRCETRRRLLRNDARSHQGYAQAARCIHSGGETCVAVYVARITSSRSPTARRN